MKETCTQSTWDSNVAEKVAESSDNAHLFNVPSRLPVKRYSLPSCSVDFDKAKQFMPAQCCK